MQLVGCVVEGGIPLFFHWQNRQINVYTCWYGHVWNYAAPIFQLNYYMILLTTKLWLNLVTFASLCPPIQGNTPSQFFHCNLQLTHSDTLFSEIYLSYGTRFHLIYYWWQIKMLFVVLLNVIFWCCVIVFGVCMWVLVVFCIFVECSVCFLFFFVV